MPATVPSADDLAAFRQETLGRFDGLSRALAEIRDAVLAGQPAPPAPEPGPVPPTAPQPTAFRLSGGSDNTNDIAGLRAYAAMRGRACDLGTVYSTRGSGWEEFVRSHAVSGQISKHADKGVTLILQTSPFPTNVGATYEALVAGEYDGYWRRIGELLAAREAQGYPPVILSPGWEMNGEYMSWGGNRAKGASHYKDPAQYRAGFARVVGAVRSTYPGARVIWTVNAHATPGSVGTTDPWDLFPGRQYVSGVGIDAYDHYPPSPDKAAFDRQATAAGGIAWLAAKAHAEGLQLWVPEWGVNNNPQDKARGVAGGDNPLYVQWMFDTFTALRGIRLPGGRPLFAGEFYYGDSTRVAGNVDSSLLDGGNPWSAERYRTLWRP